MTDRVPTRYIEEQTGYSRHYVIRYLRKQGLKPDRTENSFYWTKAEVDRVLQSYVPRPRKEYRIKVKTFTFTDAQMDIMRFARGDYSQQR